MKVLRYTLITSAFAILLSSLLISCVGDVEFGEPDFSQKAQEVQQNNVIVLTSDIDKNTLLGRVEQKGFVIMRQLESFGLENQIERITLAPDAPFEYTISENIWPGLNIKVYPFIIEDGHEFRGSTSSFYSFVSGKPVIIDNVEIIPDDELRMTGRIIITGKDFGEKYLVQNATLYTATCKEHGTGDASFKLMQSTCTNERMEFRYECYCFAAHDLYLKVRGVTTHLSTGLEAQTYEITQFEHDAKIGIPHTITVKVNGAEVESVGAYLSDKHRMSCSNQYDSSGKTKVIFSASPGKYMATPYIVCNGHEITLPKQDVTLTSLWGGIWSETLGDLGNEYRTSSNTLLWNMWDWGDQNRHSNECIDVSSYNLATGQLEHYEYEYHNYHEPWRAFGEYMLVVEGDVVYFSVSLDEQKKCIRVLKIVPGQSGVQVVGDVAYDAAKGKRNFELFAKVDDTYFFVDQASETMMTWRAKTNAIAYKAYLGRWGQFIGQDDSHFFFYNDTYKDEHIERMSISNLDNRERLDLDLSLRINTIDSRNELRPIGYVGWNGYRVYNGRIYQSNIMRSTSTTDLTDHRYYGLPSNNDMDNYILCPVGKELYCIPNDGYGGTLYMLKR